MRHFHAARIFGPDGIPPQATRYIADISQAALKLDYVFKMERTGEAVPCLDIHISATCAKM